MLNHDRTNAMQMKAQTSLLRIFSASCTAEKVSNGFLIGGRCFSCFEPGETSLKRAKNSLGTRTRRQCCTRSPIVKAIVGRAEIMQQQKKKRAECSTYATPPAFQPCRRWTLTLFISCQSQYLESPHLFIKSPLFIKRFIQYRLFLSSFTVITVNYAFRLLFRWSQFMLIQFRCNFIRWPVLGEKLWEKPAGSVGGRVLLWPMIKHWVIQLWYGISQVWYSPFINEKVL